MSGAGEDKPLSGDVGVGVDDGCGPKCESSKGNAEIGDASAGQGAAMKGEESGMRPVMCVCGVVVSIPVDVYIFQCSSCRMTLEVPKPLTDEQKKKLARRALNRWMVREAVSKELDNWLDGKETFDESSTSIVARFYRKLCEFPLFDDKSTGIDKALLDFFLFLPKIEDRLAKMGGNRTTVRTRVVNFIAGPIFYSTFGGQESEWFVEQSKHASSRGEKNDVFKTELVHVLKEIEKPDGASTLLESLESAHSLAEMPGTFSRMEQAHIQSAVANVEHSLAKTKNRSKLKSLYHLTPRRTIIKIMKMNMGNGLATAAVNLFLVRPFGSKSLMQRMACTMLGVSDSEDMALFAGKQLSPEVRARADAYIEFATTGDDSEFDVYSISDQELLYFLGDDKITQKWNCAPVPMNQIENLRANCEAYMSRLQTRSKSDSIESGGLDLSDEDDDEDDEFLVSEDGGIKVKPKDDSKKRDKIKQLFSKRKSEQEKGDRHPLQFLRMYIEEEQHYRLGQILVELLGDEKLEKLIRVSLPIVQKHLISSVTTKGSGLIPLIEGMFVAWKQILKIHKDKKSNQGDEKGTAREYHEKDPRINLHFGSQPYSWRQIGDLASASLLDCRYLELQ
uniref:PX domain-containing protein n=1 Tax=Mucochytrium quahogii TaxID=96639 RepID=A0A7S2SQ97_9STRA|mmetsp:Transcript_453/g.609  ORF Transcript_453/g.609 Transcript_453/m.609 type:complete len:620 (+) Transcript_453:52-1911(+)